MSNCYVIHTNFGEKTFRLREYEMNLVKKVWAIFIRMALNGLENFSVFHQLNIYSKTFPFDSFLPCFSSIN